MELAKIAIATAIIGGIALFFISNSLDLKCIPVSSISLKMVENKVKICGITERITSKPSFSSFFVRDNTSVVRVIAYSDINLTGGLKAEITGRVTEWKGILEIEADKIEIN